MTAQEISKYEPDENGVIVVNVDGTPRRFIKEKLIQFLSKQEGEVVLFKAKITPDKKKRGRPAKPKPIVGKRGYGNHRPKPIIAIMPDGSEKLYPSSAEAARVLNITRTNIPHALSGKYRHVGGIKFKRAL